MNERAKAIRAALKGAGYKLNQITVKVAGCGHSEDVRITVRTDKVRISAIEAIAKPFEHVRRDGFGEILAGGNTYLEVTYAKDVLAPYVAIIMDQFEFAAEDHWFAAIGTIKACKSSRAQSTYPDEVRFHTPWKGEEIACGHTFAAERIAIRHLDREVA